jgi:pyruvate formate lyase activating enzyme
MRTGGIIDISTKDIPNKSAMVIFTVGCNLRCEFCHNKHLLNTSAGQEYSVPEILSKIECNLLVSSVSITGGEPTLQKDLPQLCREIRNLNKYLSLDTNGTNPDVIQEVIPYLNRVALDIKGPLNMERLREITQSEVDISQIMDTISICNNAILDFEIRTTYVGKLMNFKDIHEILEYLRNISFRGNFVLQQYQFSEGVGEELKDKFEKPQHAILIDILKPYQNVILPFKIYARDDTVGYSEFKERIK